MEQGIQSAAATASAPSPSVSPEDLPEKKPARQLDFTPFCSAAPTATVASKQSMPQPSASRPPLPTVVKTESSPISKPQPISEGKDGAPKKTKQCNCKNSRCLKLYCECYASGVYCDGCNCINCLNNAHNDSTRQSAIELTLERNPNAFQPKIGSSPYTTHDRRDEAGDLPSIGKHNKGCHCKKTGCLKKYCECFHANIHCSENCKCMDCKNFEGGEEKRALFHGEHGNPLNHIQQPANAAITGASGNDSSSALKKRKNQDLVFGTTKFPPILQLGQFPQENLKTTAPFSSLTSVPSAGVANPTVSAPSKVTYRFLSADTVQPENVKELCGRLVMVSREAAQKLAGGQFPPISLSSLTETQQFHMKTLQFAIAALFNCTVSIPQYILSWVSHTLMGLRSAGVDTSLLEEFMGQAISSAAQCQILMNKFPHEIAALYRDCHHNIIARELEVIQNDISRTDLEQQSTQDNISRMRTRLDELQNQEKSLKEELERVKARLEEVTVESTELSKELSSSTVTLNETTDSLTHLRARSEELSSTLEKVERNSAEIVGNSSLCENIRREMVQEYDQNFRFLLQVVNDSIRP